MQSTSTIPYPLRLPTELWRDVLLKCQSHRDLLAMRALSKHHRDIVDRSIECEYHLRLLAAGLEETGTKLLINSDNGCLDRLSRYLGRWNRTKIDPLYFPREAVPPEFERVHSNKGFLVSTMDIISEVTRPMKAICLFPLPSPPKRITVPEGMTAPVPKPKEILIPHFYSYEIYPQEHLLVTADVTGTDVKSIVVVNLFHMPEGRPYFPGRREIWNHDTGKKITQVILQLTSRRLAVITRFDQSHGVNLGVFFLDWRTGETYLSAKVYTSNASFIDEYRFLGLVRSEHKNALMLWDTSHKSPSGVEFEFSTGVSPTLDVVPRNYESMSNHEPFDEDPSKGIVGLKVSGWHPTGNLFVVPVEVLVSLSNTAQQGQVSWEKWENHVTVLSVHNLSRSYKILHSQVVYVSKKVEGVMVIPVLHVYDFSCRLVKVKERSARFGPLLPESDSRFTTREITLGDNINYDNYGFEITERGVCAHPVVWEDGERRFFPI